MLTRDEFVEIVKKISGEDPSDEVFDMVERLTDDYDERNGQVTFTNEDVYADDGVAWREKYSQMRERYRKRFWGGPEDGGDSQDRGEIETETETTETTDEVEDIFRRD